MDKCPLCQQKYQLRQTIPATAFHLSSTITRLLRKLCSTCRTMTLQQLGPHPTPKKIRTLQASVNGLLTSDEVKRIRKKLNLTQKQAARICGGGPNAFSRYECGEAVPLRATSNLLRLLDKYPKELKLLIDF